MARQSSSRRFLATAVSATALLLSAPIAAEDSQPAALPWSAGPGTAPIGDDLAEIEVPEGYVFLDAEGTKKLMELTQNPLTGKEMATIAPAAQDENWFVVFEYDAVGYVKDDEKNQLDAEAMLTSIREGTEVANKEREERGWAPLEIVRWQEQPHYDERTNNLSWAIVGHSDAGGDNVNKIVKVLGRRGVMTVTLVAAPQELASAGPRVDTLLDGYHYKHGSTYAEYVPDTDKLAEYGLTALVVGGAGAALVQSGLLAKLWKPIALGIAALGGAVKRMLFGGRKAETSLEGPIA